MKTKELMDQITEAISSGDKLMDSKRYSEAIPIYKRVEELFRAMESAQQEAYPGGPTQIPLSLRIMVFHRQITVPLDRLADAYMAIGDFDIALQYLQEAVERLEEAANLASGDTKRSFEKDLSRFLRKLRETQKKSAERTPQEPQFWIAYRGDDSGGRIKVFPGGVRASAERLKFLMSQAARHQNGQVSNIYLAEDEAEALRMAPYQFP